MARRRVAIWVSRGAMSSRLRAVGVFGEVLAVALGFAYVGFAVEGVNGNGLDGVVGGVGVEDEPDGPGGRVESGQGDRTLGPVAPRNGSGEPGAVLKALAEL